MDETDNTEISDETQWLVDIATYIDDDIREEMLQNYQQATSKIDGAVAQATHHAKDALQCQRGCSSCCAAGLSVLPIEAVGILQALLRGDFVWSAAQQADFTSILQQALLGNNAESTAHCVFLDAEGACLIYTARPWLCRTHGLALTVESATPTEQTLGQRKLRILDDKPTEKYAQACHLNYQHRLPTAKESLDTVRIQTLLTTINAMFLQQLPDGFSVDPEVRIPLLALAQFARHIAE